MQNSSFNYYECKFVLATEIFKDCLLAHKVYEHNGSNFSRDPKYPVPHSLIGAELIYDTLIEFVNIPNKKASEEIKIVLNRLNSLSKDTYVDLAN